MPVFRATNVVTVPYLHFVLDFIPKNMKKFRNNGAVGAFLDEYERAIQELIGVIQEITPQELTIAVDNETKDPDCISIQTILTHIIRAGYGYVIEIRNYLGEELTFRKEEVLQSTEAYQIELLQLLVYNEELFEDYPNIVIEEQTHEKKMKAKWGQYYDVEQLMEHAIVHVLRHRRQVELFLLYIR